MNSTQPLLLVFLLSFIIACAPDDGPGDPGPPPAKDVLAATINGARITTTLPAAERSDLPNGLDPDNPFKSALVRGVNIASQNVIVVNIIQSSVPTAKQYQLDGECVSLDECILISYATTVNGGDNIEYTTGTDPQSHGTVDVITLDYQEDGRIKGTFSGTMVDEDTNTTLKIEDGEFDVAFKN